MTDEPEDIAALVERLREHVRMWRSYDWTAERAALCGDMESAIAALTAQAHVITELIRDRAARQREVESYQRDNAELRQDIERLTASPKSETQSFVLPVDAATFERLTAALAEIQADAKP